MRKRITIEADIPPLSAADKSLWYATLVSRFRDALHPHRMVYCAVEDIIEPDVIAGYRNRNKE